MDCYRARLRHESFCSGMMDCYRARLRHESFYIQGWWTATCARLRSLDMNAILRSGMMDCYSYSARLRHESFCIQGWWTATELGLEKLDMNHATFRNVSFPWSGRFLCCINLISAKLLIKNYFKKGGLENVAQLHCRWCNESYCKLCVILVCMLYSDEISAKHFWWFVWTTWRHVVANLFTPQRCVGHNIK